MYKLDEFIQYLNEFLATRNENIIPLADFRKFLREKKGLRDKGSFGSMILKLSAYGHLFLYKDVTNREYIIKDPSKFDEKEFLISTRSTAARIYTFILTIMELQAKNPNNYINIRTVFAEYRKKYPKLYYHGIPVYHRIKMALCKLGYLDCIGAIANRMNIRLTEKFKTKYPVLTVPKFKELLAEIRPYISKSTKNINE